MAMLASFVHSFAVNCQWFTFDLALRVLFIFMIA